MSAVSSFGRYVGLKHLHIASVLNIYTLHQS